MEREIKMRKNSKLLSLVLLFCFLLGMFTACKKKEAEDTPYEVVKAIQKYADADAEWIELKSSEIKTRLGISEKGLIEGSAVINKDELKQDITAVFKFEDEKSKLLALEAIEKNLKAAETNLESANKTEKAKIKNRLIMQKGNIVAVVVSGNKEKIEQMLKEKGYK